MSDCLDVCTATRVAALHLPPGSERDEILCLIRLGWQFKQQRVGKRPGVLAVEMLAMARRTGDPITFERMLEELESAAVRRAIDGEGASAIEKVDRVWGVVTYHDRQRRKQVTFKRICNLVTWCKKNLKASIPDHR